MPPSLGPRIADLTSPTNLEPRDPLLERADHPGATLSDKEPPVPKLLPVAEGSFRILSNRSSGVAHIVQALDSSTVDTWGLCAGPGWT